MPGNVYLPLSVNRYLYCQNQPLNYVDLNGKSREDARDYMDEYDKDHFDERNPDYPSYGANCANYVSQCLTAGGVEQKYGEWFCGQPSEINPVAYAYWKACGICAPIGKTLGF